MILWGVIFLEEVRVLVVKLVGLNWIKLEVVGINSKRYYDFILILEEIVKLEYIGILLYDFSGDFEVVFFYLEGFWIWNVF